MNRKLSLALMTLIAIALVPLVDTQVKPEVEHLLACRKMENQLNIKMLYPDFYTCTETNEGYVGKMLYIDSTPRTLFISK